MTFIMVGRDEQHHTTQRGETMARAKQGGEYGANGEFYKGGQFLNTVAENPKKEGSKPKRKKTGKREVAPYTWEVQPTPEARSIYTMLAGVYGRVEGGQMVLNINPQTLSYYGDEQAEIEALANRWNNGERWI